MGFLIFLLIYVSMGLTTAWIITRFELIEDGWDFTINTAMTSFFWPIGLPAVLALSAGRYVIESARKTRDEARRKEKLP